MTLENIEKSFSQDELSKLSATFTSFDSDASGSIDFQELKDALRQLGESADDKTVMNILKEADLNADGTVSFQEFLFTVKLLKEGKKTSMGAAAAKAAKIIVQKGEVGQHSYSEEETAAFSDFINARLSTDADLKEVLPLSPDGLFAGVGNGVLLCKLINSAVPDTIDERVINKKAKLNPWERNENHQLAINSAKAIGCMTVNVTTEMLNEGRPHIVLGLVWQIIKIGLTKDINVKQHKELVLLLKEGETLEDLLKLPPEELLLRWVNYHLEKSGSTRRINNFSGDIKDSEAYTLLLKQICPANECNLNPLNESDPLQRAELMLQEADKIGCRQFVAPRDVVNGNPKLNLAFVANLFNNHPALVLSEAEEEQFDFAELLNFDNEGTREERSFRYWIQSLGIDCNNLFDDCKNGLLLVKVEDKVEAGIVEWKKVNNNPKMKIHCMINCNLVVEYAKKMGMSMVNIGGGDIYEGNKKLILGIVWQLMKHNLLALLSQLGGGKKIDEAEVLAWANKKVGTSKIDSFKDSSIKTGVFMCQLVSAIAPKSCNPDLISAGDNDEDAQQNAKYAISVARKIGCSIFCLHEDLFEVKPKMVLSFVASLMIADQMMSRKK